MKVGILIVVGLILSSSVAVSGSKNGEFTQTESLPLIFEDQSSSMTVCL